LFHLVCLYQLFTHRRWLLTQQAPNAPIQVFALLSWYDWLWIRFSPNCDDTSDDEDFDALDDVDTHVFIMIPTIHPLQVPANLSILIWMHRFFTFVPLGREGDAYNCTSCVSSSKCTSDCS